MLSHTTMASIVIPALERQGWLITHQPLRMLWYGIESQLDLAANNNSHRSIAIAIYPPHDDSGVPPLTCFLGQALVTQAILGRLDPMCTLYCALDRALFTALLAAPLRDLLRSAYQMRFIVVDATQEEAIQWIPAQAPAQSLNWS